jgi:hypothetical protein
VISGIILDSWKAERTSAARAGEILAVGHVDVSWLTTTGSHNHAETAKRVAMRTFILISLRSVITVNQVYNTREVSRLRFWLYKCGEMKHPPST